MELVDELRALSKAFESQQISYAVCDGLAVTIHGRPRLTIDIDIDIPKPLMDEAIQLAGSVGFDVQNGWVAFPRNDFRIDRQFRLTKIEEGDFLTLDLLEANSEANRFFASRESVSLGDQNVVVLSKDSIIEMKSRSDRTKDRLDIEMLQDDTNTNGGCRKASQPWLVE